eukprot:scaffold190103_cov13-Tisochrysis_lutea.AAC.1
MTGSSPKKTVADRLGVHYIGLPTKQNGKDRESAWAWEQFLKENVTAASSSSSSGAGSGGAADSDNEEEQGQQSHLQ